MGLSLHKTIKRSAAALLASIVIAAATAGAAVGQDRPAASFYTPAQLEAISQSWAARGGVFLNRPAASFYTPAQLRAISQSWAARARHEATSQTVLGTGSGFDWGDFAIGAGAMLGLVLLLGGLAAGAHYGRRSGIRTRTAS